MTNLKCQLYDIINPNLLILYSSSFYRFIFSYPSYFANLYYDYLIDFDFCSFSIPCYQLIKLFQVNIPQQTYKRQYFLPFN